MKLDGQTAVVTGAGRGIGRAIALEQARQGARVGLVSRSLGEITEVAREITDAGGEAKAYSADVTDHDGVQSTFSAIADDLGPISLVTNNAASFMAIGPIWEVDPDVWWRDIEINIRGVFNCCRAVLPGMIERGQGRIINMTGGGTATPFPHGSGYGTSKSGVLRFTESVLGTLEGTGVLMFGMDPGLVRTSMTEYQLSSDAGQAYLKDLPGLFETGISVPPTKAAELSVEIGSGRFDRLAGRMLMAARGDSDLTEADIDKIVREDLRSLRVNGMPEEKPQAKT